MAAQHEAGHHDQPRTNATASQVRITNWTSLHRRSSTAGTDALAEEAGTAVAYKTAGQAREGEGAVGS